MCMNKSRTNQKLTPQEQLIGAVLSNQDKLETLQDNIPLLRKLDEDGLSYISYTRKIKTRTGNMMIRDYVGEDLWCCLVLLYGDYGVTNRSGWIENKQRFFNMLRSIDEEDFMEYDMNDKR